MIHIGTHNGLHVLIDTPVYVIRYRLVGDLIDPVVTLLQRVLQ